jgi:hypothetical protein
LLENESAQRKKETKNLINSFLSTFIPSWHIYNRTHTLNNYCCCCFSGRL